MPAPAPIDLGNAPGAVPLERDGLIVRGPDAAAFLQGQLSQDIEALGLGASAPSFLLQPTGKVDAWLRVTRLDADELLLDVEAGWGDAVLARLKRFLLRTKAELEPGRWSGLALRGPGVGAAADAVDLGPGVRRLAAGWPGEGVDLLGPGGSAVATGVPAATAESLHALRVESGVPSMGSEIDGSTIPAELGQWVIDASVSFTKGCYTGQELVARIDSRGGNVPRPVRGLLLDGLASPGDTVSFDGVDVGRATSTAVSPAVGPVALAVLARSVTVGSAITVAAAGGSVTGRVSELPLR